MTENKKRDSLHYFMSYDDLSGSSSSSSSSESEDEGQGSSKRKRGADPAGESEDVSHQGAKRAASGSPLPKPDDLFKSVSKPTFLYNPLNKHIDWESRIVKAPEEPAKEFKAWKTNAVPPPQTYATEKKGAPPGMDMAIKWSNVYEDNGEDAPKPTTGNAHFLPDDEKPFQSDEEQEQEKTLSAKKRKVESFQQKEKRKRDLGQATSDKSFVEEEKRILRQSIE